jgi:hypothetical protein
VGVLGDKQRVEAAFLDRPGQSRRCDALVGDERRDAEFHVPIEQYRDEGEASHLSGAIDSLMVMVAKGS